MSESETTKKEKSFLAFLMWWKTDPIEVEKQVAQYDSMKVWQSGRGMSLLLCAFSVALTTLLGSWLKLSGSTIIGEAVIWGLLGLFMYRGHRWAFVAAMILWTVEKGTMLLAGSPSGNPIVQVIWWAVYMNAFMLGFKVEAARRKQATVIAPAPI
jgi:hypothetical protein